MRFEFGQRKAVNTQCENWLCATVFTSEVESLFRGQGRFVKISCNEYFGVKRDKKVDFIGKNSL